MNKNFAKVRSTKDIVIPSVLTAAGLILVALPTSTSINIAGFFMIFAGIILFMTLKTGYKDENGLNFRKTEHYFAQSQKEEIARAINKRPVTINLDDEDKGNGLRLDMYYSKKTGKAYVQLFEYIPYKYEPCSGLSELEMTEINIPVK